MDLYHDILQQMPTTQQEVAILAFGIATIGLILWLVWKRQMREEHALFWFIGIVIGVIMVWNDTLLAMFSYTLGINLPANALMLAAVFFLFAMSIWLTSVASRNKQRIERLVTHVSILNTQVQEIQTALAAGKPRAAHGDTMRGA